MPGKPPCFRNIPAQRDGVLELRGDWKHAQQVGLLQWSRQPCALKRNIQNIAGLMLIQAFQRCPEQRGRRRKASSKLQGLLHRGGAFQLKDGGNADVAGDGHLGPNRRDVNHIAGEQRSVLGHVAEYQQIV